MAFFYVSMYQCGFHLLVAFVSVPAVFHKQGTGNWVILRVCRIVTYEQVPRISTYIAFISLHLI
jgi:hypothetical protein